MIIAFISLPFIIGWTLWRGYKNPEFWLRIRKQDWVYQLVRTPMLKLLQVVVPLSRIGENGEFRTFKDRRYFWQEKDKAGRSTIINWRHGKAAALYDWNDPYPQAWIPGKSLHSITDPKTLDDISELKALKMMLNADSMTMLMRVSLVIAIVGIVVTAGIGFTVLNMGHSVDHLSCVLSSGSNATLAAACH